LRAYARRARRRMQQPRASACSRTRVCIRLRAPTCGRTSPRIHGALSRASARVGARGEARVCQVGKPILKRHRIFIPRCTVATDKNVHRALRTYGTPVIAPSGIRTTGALYASGSPDREATWTVRSPGKGGIGGGGRRESIGELPWIGQRGGQGAAFLRTPRPRHCRVGGRPSIVNRISHPSAPSPCRHQAGDRRGRVVGLERGGKKIGAATSRRRGDDFN